MDYRKKNELSILLGNATTNIGNTLFIFIINWWIIDVTNSSELLGVISAIILLPKVLLSLFGGVLADKYNKKYLVIGTDVISGVGCLMSTFFIDPNTVNVTVVVIINVLINTCQSIFTPAIRSILPEIINEERIQITNSRISMINETIKLTAPLLGGYLVTLNFIDVRGIFILNGITFLISALVELIITYSYKKNEEHSKNEMLVKLKLGFLYSWNDKNLFRLLICISFINLFISGFTLSLPVIAKKMDMGISAYSYFLGAEAVGGLLGAFSLNFKKNDNIVTYRNLSNELMLSGLSLSILLINRNYWIMITSIVLFSYFIARFNVKFFSLVQVKVDKEYLGRVFSLIFVLAQLLMPIGNLIFGYILDYTYQYIVPIIGVSIIICTYIILSKNKSQEEVQ